MRFHRHVEFQLHAPVVVCRHVFGHVEHVDEVSVYFFTADILYLGKSKQAKGKNKAIKQGYVACSRCGGESSGYIKEEYKN